MNKLSLKLGFFIFIFILVVNGLLFFILYTNAVDSRVEEVMQNLLARGNSHRDVLEKQFNEQTLHHVALMESEADTTVVITNKEKEIMEQSEFVDDHMDAFIHQSLTSVHHAGKIIDDEWKDSAYVATVSPLYIDEEEKGYVYMFADTNLIQRVVNQLARQFLFVGVIALLLILVAIVFFSYLITRPLIHMKQATEELMKGKGNVYLNDRRKDELGQLASSIVSLSKELDRLKEERKDFLASISHELRTPLTYIKGYAAIARRDSITEENRQHYLGVIMEETDHVTTLVKQLFDLAKMDQNEFDIHKENVLLCDVLHHVKNKVNPIMAERGLHLHVCCEEGLVGYVDKHRLQQVLGNLIDNSVKHSHYGDSIFLRAMKRKRMLEISVADEGDGIPEEDMPFLFERLYRVDKSRSRAFGGTGLGLSIVKEIVEKHGGQVTVVSELNEGTTVTIVIPMEVL
ncbi:sensor histidine kinase [Pontibacillus litoralis]|uniref:histidine kinase n=1 Tax=Pontibacillus litoralis JSM 072002 TaxID=1385512 RepID=A0A0A5G1R3_9BACI|nr:HAMP domain-containing sensor histidine kinase [Pontibacillus litoralis]KGX87021.1 sensor histidine kinase [Pontibacillus litoralis JSM 072002]